MTAPRSVPYWSIPDLVMHIQLVLGKRKLL
jgi:hypothetical protein